MPEIDIEARVTYGHRKTVHFERKRLEDVVKVLKDDLRSLDLPAPKEGMIRWNYPNSLYFSWMIEKDNYLHKSVVRIVNSLQPKKKEELAIENFILVEKSALNGNIGALASTKGPTSPILPLPLKPVSPPQKYASSSHTRRPSYDSGFSSNKRLPSLSLPAAPAEKQRSAEDPKNGPTTSPTILEESRPHPRADCKAIELRIVREEIVSGRRREQVILEKLGQLGTSQPLSNTESDHICTLKRKIETSEAALQHERRKRLATEQLLRDIKRESTEPVVIPTLIQALCQISQSPL